MATSYRKGPSTPHGPSLTSAACRAALRDPTHLFRAMWAARRDSSEQSPQCWDVPRRHTNETGPPGALDGFDERVLSGSACRRGRLDENWYHTVGKPHVRLVRDTMYTHGRPEFTAPALGLLGFDDSFEQHCGSETAYRLGTPTACALANFNVLSVEERRYNLCRNLEWQACAARGLLPGQGGSGIVFSVAPSSLLLPKYGYISPSPLRRTFGVCGGPLPNTCRACTYANDDIFFLEVCLFDHLSERPRHLPSQNGRAVRVHLLARRLQNAYEPPSPARRGG